MLLGAVLGLRACDIVALKFSDVDWVRGEIRIIQSKTTRSGVLPLTADVGEALKDYILNARPSSVEKQIFLRLKAPFTPLKSAVTIGEVYRDCCIVAGISASKRFHNLRRTLATAMIKNGVSAYDVKEVLIDKRVDSIKQYISLDSDRLKICALPFDGIMPVGGAK